MSQVETVVHSWANDMRSTDISPQAHRGMTAARWVLIAICAVLILFSDHMAGRLGFAALLLMAVMVGRYGRSHGRLRDRQASEPMAPTPTQLRLPEAAERRREAQQ